MPLHNYVCDCGSHETRFCKIAELDQPQICECGARMERRILAPMVQADYAPYQSPVDGREISGRRARKEDLLRSNCVEYEPSLGRIQEERRARAEVDLDASVERTLDKTLTEMPARKKELLVEELQSGADVNITRR